jgi:hypothetical protein
MALWFQGFINGKKDSIAEPRPGRGELQMKNEK